MKNTWLYYGQEPHRFEGVLEGVADRPCTACGLPDRHPVHHMTTASTAEVGKLDWKRFGEVYLGLRDERVLAIVRATDEEFPTPAYSVSYPDALFLSLHEAKAFAERHRRCTVHGVEGCGLCAPGGDL